MAVALRSRNRVKRRFTCRKYQGINGEARRKKSEIRNPRAEGDQNNIREANSLAWPKSEGRKGTSLMVIEPALRCFQWPRIFVLHSTFGLRISFGFRSF